MKAGRVRRLRQTSQIVFFGFFMLLFVQAVYLGESRLPSDPFYRFDPLIATTAMLAGRTVIFGLLYSLFTIAGTLLVGRVWCGWICPFGSMMEWLSPKSQTRHIPDQWRALKEGQDYCRIDGI